VTRPAPVAEVLDFWFGPLTAGVARPARRRRWFSASADDDDEIRARFAHLIERAGGGGLDAWLASPEGTLAFILVCDQFPRQAFRGTPRAFATDGVAREAARRGIERGHDRAFGVDQRAFFYMPFQHAESRADQHLSVGLFSALSEGAPAASRELAATFVEHAREHRDVVVEFGRFPHRNDVLGRRSTPAERRFLETAKKYGQGRRDR
jgi:uncharacterized protein (DUF924 family)